MTILEDQLRDFIRKDMLGENMGGTELLLLKEFGIPILLELVKRRNADKEVQATIAKLQDDPERALEAMTAQARGGIVKALADLLDPLIEQLFGK